MSMEKKHNIIDIRPRVSTLITAGARSPLEFLGRTFDGSGNSAANILASDESINVDFHSILEELIEFSSLKMENYKFRNPVRNI